MIMKILRILGIVAALLVIIILTMPSILSTKSGKDFALNILNKEIPGKLEIESLDLNWFRTSQITQLKLKDENGQLLASAETVKLFNPLWKLITSSHPQPVLEINQLNATVKADIEGTTNLERAVFFKSFEKTKKQELPSIELVDTYIKSEFDRHATQIQAKGNTLQNNQKGLFNFALKVAREIEGTFSFKDFPVLILDQVVTLQDPKYKGAALELLGQKVSVEGKATNGHWQFDLKSENLTGKGEGKTSLEEWMLTSPTTFQGKITPNLITILTEGKLSLKTPTLAVVEIDNFHPTNEWVKGIITLNNIVMSDNLSLPKVEIQVAPTKLRVESTGSIVGVLKVDLNHEASILKWQKWLDQPGKLEGNFTGYNYDITYNGQFNQEGISLVFNGSSPDVTFIDGKLESRGTPWEEINRLEHLKLKGLLTALSIKTKQGELKDVNLPWEYDGRYDEFNADLSAKTIGNSPINGSVNYKKGDINYKIDAPDLPISLFPLPDSPLVNKLSQGKVKISAEGHFDKLGKGEANYLLSTSEIDANGKVIFKSFNAFELGTDPLVINIHITPERLNDLTSGQFTSDKKVLGTLTLDQLKLANPISDSVVALRLSIQPFALKEKNVGRKIELQGLKGNVKSARLNDLITFDLQEAQGTGLLNVKGEIKNLFTNAPSYEIKADAESFPTAFVATLLPSDNNLGQKLNALMGTSFNANIKASIQNMNGPIAVNLKGTNFDLYVDGRLERDTLLLNQPLVANLVFSQEIGDAFLDDFIPLLNSATRADKPIRLTLHPQNFSLPLKDISAVNTQIPYGTLELNKLYFTREGKIAQILAMLNARTGSEFSVWFTPLYFRLTNGVFSLSRLDLLVAEQYPIATWGNINFNKDYVAMEVGLTGRTLSQSFSGIPLPKNYMLTLPLRGPTSNPRLDTTKVAAKLSSLAAMAAGPQGILVGALIDLAAGGMTDSVPAPTTNPLPWQTEAPEASSTAETDATPMNNLQKGAKKLFDNFFGN